MAPARAGRPHTTRATKRATTPTSPNTESCPFCPGNESQTPPELARTGAGGPGEPGWRARVFPNLYPIVDGDIGTHEVVALSPSHDRSLGRLSHDEVIELFDLLADRVAAHERAGYASSQVIINHGRSAGASIEHPHAQVLGLHLQPPTIVAETRRLERSACVVCALQGSEGAPDSALTVITGDAPAWCPSASAFPYEMLVAPGEHLVAFHADDRDAALARAAVARTMGEALARLDATLDDPPYNVVVHAPPFATADFHWHIHIWPRISNLAGLELGAGIGANTVLPETAATALKGALG